MTNSSSSRWYIVDHEGLEWGPFWTENEAVSWARGQHFLEGWSLKTR